MGYVHVALVREKFRLVFCCLLISFFVSNINLFSRVEGLFGYIIHIIIHTIKHAVGIANCGSCEISRGCRLNGKVPNYVFITSVSKLSPLNLGVMFPFVFFSVQYQFFCLRFWNLPCDIIYLMLILFHLLCGIYFCCLRLWNLACQILGLVLFVFDPSLFAIFLLSSVEETCPWHTWHCVVSFQSSLCDTILLFSVVEPCLWETYHCAVFFHLLCAISLSGLWLLNVACGMDVHLVLFLFVLLYVTSFCCPRLLNLACGMSSKCLCCLLLFHLSFLMARECVSFILLFYVVFLMS